MDITRDDLRLLLTLLDELDDPARDRLLLGFLTTVYPERVNQDN